MRRLDGSRRRALLTGCALVLLCLGTGAALLPALGAGFVYDDYLYLVGNPQVAGGLSPAAAAWAFSSFHAANWHPLTWLSHQADVSLFGLSPRSHHAVNLALHAANACLLFLVLRGATGAAGRSLAVAALFAMHPLHVESAAWVAERKDLLAGFFWILALGAWLRYGRRPAPAALAATTGLFALALLAKPMPVSLPALLLVLDVWPLGRVPLFRGFPGQAAAAAWRRALLEKLPLLALSAASTAVTLAAQGSGGAMLTVERLGFGPRLANALLSVVAYLRQAAWPADLAVFYPHPGHEVSAAGALAAAALLAALAGGATALVRRHPYLAAGGAWFAVTLLPVIGLVQAGEQARADRYTYVPLTGVFLAVVWAGAALSRRLPPLRVPLALAAVAAIAALGAVSARQAGYWRDNATLYRRALAVTERNWAMHANLGTVLSWEGRYDEAIPHLREAVALQPRFADGWLALGTTLLRAGRPAEAEPELRRALRLRPGHAETHCALGQSLAAQGRPAVAETALRRALELRPSYPDALFVLGVVLGRRGQRPEAAAAMRGALRLDPGHAGARQAAAALGIEVDIPSPPP